MNYKLLVGILAFPWAIAALMTATMYLSGDVASSDSGETAAQANFLNSAANPNESRISVPAVGGTNNPIGTEISYPTTGPGWLSGLAHSVTLTGPLWPQWTQPIRYILYVFVSPALLLFSIMLAQAFSFFISSIFGRVTP